MSEIPDEIVKLQSMLDDATDSLLEASDDEIIEDIQKMGGEPGELAQEAQAIFKRTLQANRLRRRLSQMVEYDEEADITSRDELREIIERITELESALRYLAKELPAIVSLICENSPHHRATIESVLEEE